MKINSLQIFLCKECGHYHHVEELAYEPNTNQSVCYMPCGDATVKTNVVDLDWKYDIDLIVIPTVIEDIFGEYINIGYKFRKNPLPTIRKFAKTLGLKQDVVFVNQRVMEQSLPVDREEDASKYNCAIGIYPEYNEADKLVKVMILILTRDEEYLKNNE